MRHSLLQACASVLFAALAPAASAAVLTFDDIGTDGAIPANYGGLDWSLDGWSVFAETQAPYTPHSGSYRAATNFGADDAASAVGFLTPGRFDGAWFSGLSGATVTFRLYLGDALVATSATLDPTDVPAFLASGYAGLVDRVVVASPEHASFAMDDFTYSAPVPEPAEFALVLTGLAALGLHRARRPR